MVYKLTKTKNGYYYVRVQVGGVRKGAYAKTEAEAREKLKALQRQAALDGGFANAHKRTLNDLVSAWLESAPIRESTRVWYEETLRRLVLPTLGSVRLDRITPQRIEALYHKLGASKAEQAHRALRRAFAVAVRWRWLSRNPCADVERPKYTPPKPRLWSVDQTRTFIAAARDYPLLVFLITTGLRLGEALALRWKDVGFGGAAVNVNGTAKRLRGEWVFTTPKTASGARTVLLPKPAREALQRLLAARPDAQPEDFVFCGARNPSRPVHQSNVRKQLLDVCAKAGLPPVRVHDLRHLHASLLLAEGVPVTEVAARLGHASPQVTLRIYAHAVRDQRAAVLAVERALGV